MEIDIVITFVDNHDPIWQESFKNYCVENNYIDKLENFAIERYENMHLIKYWFACVNKFMPWVRNIFMVVSNIEQVPQEIADDPKLKVVLHKEIIPAKFLPTFNSKCIEMFLHNIEELSEYYIYFNDDIYPIKPLQPTDFFTANGRIRTILQGDSIYKTPDNVFRNGVLTGFNYVADYFKFSRPKGYYKIPLHTATPMIKSHCKECRELFAAPIESRLTAFRTPQQCNQYLFVFWEYFKYKVSASQYNFLLASVEDTTEKLRRHLNMQMFKLVCINDIVLDNRNKVNLVGIKQVLEEILGK